MTSFVHQLYNSYVSYNRNAENQKYWADYKKNTGKSPRYPYRSGAYYDYTWAFQALEAPSCFTRYLYR